MSNNENAPEVTAPERIWLEAANNCPDPRFTFTEPAREWSECRPNTPGALQYVRADISQAEADELRAEVERLKAENAHLKVKLEWAEAREQNAADRAANWS